MMRIIPASDSSLLVEFGTSISPEIYARVLALFRALQAEKQTRIRNLHPAYASLLIDFNPFEITHAELEEYVRELTELTTIATDTSSRTISIPVCYDADFAPDLSDVAAHNGISTNDVIDLHTSTTYLVYFLGFSPGFAYLGGLDSKLHTPRLATPRKHVIAGSVGIAGEQTGVYPIDSAGGWRLIGRTPLRMFDPNADPPSRLQPGDHVQFRAISRSKFDEMENE